MLRLNTLESECPEKFRTFLFDICKRCRLAGEMIVVLHKLENRFTGGHLSYLKLTYRAALPYITVRVQYDQIKRQLRARLCETQAPIMFNSGELADSLAMEHLTRAGREFIPWFGTTENGYLFMLTKSDNVDAILDLPHSGHTVVAWSINADIVSRKLPVPHRLKDGLKPLVKYSKSAILLGFDWIQLCHLMVGRRLIRRQFKGFLTV